MAAEMISKNRVLYFYGVTKSRSGLLVHQPGVDLQSKIEPVECDSLTCWVSRVSAEEFETNLSRNMENLDWVATASVAHQRAISAIAQDQQILPARFGTVFRTQDSLRKHIRERMRAIKQDFERIKDADEWGVKVFAVSAHLQPAPQVKTGIDYLKAKAALLPRKRSKATRNGDYAEFENALRRVALESAAVGNVSSGQRGLRFQTSLLVKRKDRTKLESVLKKFSERWSETRRIECTGPWPPYSFVSRPDREHDQE
jgi:Gas vesicle synthesis protein GvpL/GvpF